MFENLFFPAIIFIGIITSYEDIKYGKIRNKWILLGIYYFLLIFFLFFLWNLAIIPILKIFKIYILKDSVNELPNVLIFSWTYLGKTITNFIATVFVSFLMWRFHAWSAGDAKLFIVFSLLIPISFYWKSYFPIFPSFILLINIFALILFFIFYKSLLYNFKKIYKSIQNFKKSKNQVNDIKIKINSFFKNLNVGRSQFNMLLVIILLLFTVDFFNDYILINFNINTYTILSLAFVASIIFPKQLQKYFSKPFLLNICFFLLFIVSFLSLLNNFQLTIQKLHIISKSAFVFMVIFSIFNLIINSYINDVDKKNLQKAFPFAPWIFLGVIVTLILKKSLLTFLPLLSYIF